MREKTILIWLCWRSYSNDAFDSFEADNQTFMMLRDILSARDLYGGWLKPRSDRAMLTWQLQSVKIHTA